MDNSERIRKWREQNATASRSVPNAPTSWNDAPELELSAGQAQAGVAPENDQATPQSRLVDREERLRVWRLERQRVAESERAERLERLLQQREAISRERQSAQKAKLSPNPFEPMLASTQTTEDRLRDSNPSSDSSPLLEAPIPALSEGGMSQLRQKLQERQREQTGQRTILLMLLWLLGFVVLTYHQWVATRLYTATATLTVLVNREEAQPAMGVFKLGGGPTMTDAFKAQAYILSSGMMQEMESQMGMMRYYAQDSIDPLQRLNSPWGLHQDPLTYFRSRVKVAVDIQEGLIHLFVQAFSPEMAQRFAQQILKLTERHVNEMNERSQLDQLSALENDVREAERTLTDARKVLSQAQQKQGLIEPRSSATAVYQLIASLEAQLAEARRERISLLRSGLDMSPLLPRLDSQIVSLQQQIAEQNDKLVSASGRPSLQQGLSDFEDAVSRRDLAQMRWTSAVKTLQDARLQNLRDRRYVLVVSSPHPQAGQKVWRVLAWSLLMLLGLAIIHGTWSYWQLTRRLQT
jgi:capsular polysaccharide transport system permease protein